MKNTDFNLNAIYKLMRYAKEYGHEKVKFAGYTATEHLICTYIYYHEDASQDDVAEYLAMDKTTVAKALSALERKGIVLREENSDNRRKNKLSLTDEGKSGIVSHVDIYKEWADFVTDGLTDEEKRQFMEIGEKIAARAKELSEE